MSIFNLLDTVPQTGAPDLGMLAITVVAMILIFYFFLIRPQKKQENETKKMLEALKKGDKVVTIGGIYGTVSSVKDSTVVVKVDDSAKIEFSKTAIAKVVNENADEKTVAAKENKESKKAAKKAESEEK